jgi:hypothetical protein
MRVATSGTPHCKPLVWLSNCELEPTTAKLVVHAFAIAAVYSLALDTTRASTFTVRPARPPVPFTVAAHASTPLTTGAVSATTVMRIVWAVMPTSLAPFGVVVGVV